MMQLVSEPKEIIYGYGKVVGGELAITHTVKKKIGNSKTISHSPYPNQKKVFRVDLTHFSHNFPKHTDTRYPYPFNQEFFDFLGKLPSLSESEVAGHYQSFSNQKVVILAKIQHRKRKYLLDQLTGYIVANAYIQQVIREFSGIQLVKSNGDLGIFVTDSDEQAVEFAQKLFDKLQGNGFTLNIGLSRGEVLLFPLQTGFEIAGGPVNIASKIDEDGGLMNKILVEESVQLPKGNREEFSFTISKVEIKGKYI